MARNSIESIPNSAMTDATERLLSKAGKKESK